MNPDELNQWILTVISGLVSIPDEIEIEKTKDEMGTIYTVRVAKIDRGKVIGKKGAIAEALRTIVRSAGHLKDVRVSLILDIPAKEL